MRGAIPLLPNTSSWHGAWLSTGTALPLPFIVRITASEIRKMQGTRTNIKRCNNWSTNIDLVC
jgi:hypothetical protein